MTPDEPARLLRNWRDELDSAALYAALAQIERDAADFIDLLAITVQAGLGLDQRLLHQDLHGLVVEYDAVAQ